MKPDNAKIHALEQLKKENDRLSKRWQAWANDVAEHIGGLRSAGLASRAEYHKAIQSARDVLSFLALGKQRAVQGSLKAEIAALSNPDDPEEVRRFLVQREPGRPFFEYGDEYDCLFHTPKQEPSP